MADLTRAELIQLADEKLDDARMLLRESRPGNAYYLAGYAVELLLKAAISTRFQANTIPDPGWAKDIFTHSLEKLVKLALLDNELKAYGDTHDQFKGRWDIVLEWKEDSRYYIREQSDAEALIAAIDDPIHGVFQWLRERL